MLFFFFRLLISFEGVLFLPISRELWQPSSRLNATSAASFQIIKIGLSDKMNKKKISCREASNEARKGTWQKWKKEGGEGKGMPCNQKPILLSPLNCTQDAICAQGETPNRKKKAIGVIRYSPKRTGGQTTTKGYKEECADKSKNTHKGSVLNGITRFG